MTTEKKRVLVAGATGYLGGFVAREFKAQGHFVRALARSPRKLDPIKDLIDEIVTGEITRPDSITSICDGIDIVFSSVGITRQKGNLTFKDVDYQGNLNLLQIAKKAGVKKFIYISALKGSALKHLAIVKAHEDFVDELKASGMDYIIMRPTGYFSDMGEFFNMANKGRIFLIGPGQNRMNPIHGEDLASAIVNAVDGENQEIDIGGPDIFTWREIAGLAQEVLGRPVKIYSVPLWIMRSVVSITKLFNRHQGELLAFFTAMGVGEMVAPAYGVHTLKEYYRELAAREADA